MADVAAGLVFASQGIWPAGAGPFWLMGSSLCVYHGAMALNDWHDREHDARTRPARPIPSGAVHPKLALVIAATLLLLGPLFALLHSRDAGLWSAGLATLAISYDLTGANHSCRVQAGPLVQPTALDSAITGDRAGLRVHGGTGAFDYFLVYSH